MKDLLYGLATDKNNSLFASFLKVFLLLFSFLYGILIRILIFFSRFDQKRLDIRVISIGNITLGGTGKTSLVEFVSRRLHSRGYKIAVLSRGYKRKSFDTLGDEPRMLLNNLAGVPVIVGKNRFTCANRAKKEYNCDTVILDDGMQQWRINKDLEIVTIDALSPFGNSHMLPRGILRQPLSTLKKADIFVLTKTNLSRGLRDLRSRLNKYNSNALIVESVHDPVGFYPLGDQGKLLDKKHLEGERVAILSGIGDPESFARTILKLKIKIGLDLRFSDHHHYTTGELELIADKVRENNIRTLITTEKDSVKIHKESLACFSGIDFLVLRIELKIIKNEELFLSRLFGVHSS